MWYKCRLPPVYSWIRVLVDYAALLQSVRKADFRRRLLVLDGCRLWLFDWWKVKEQNRHEVL